MTRCKVILPLKAYRQGERCQKRALNPSVGLCETHLAKMRRDSERKMLADIERDRARASSRKSEPRSLCDACGREFPENEVSECDACGMPACDECRGDRCCADSGALEP